MVNRNIPIQFYVNKTEFQQIKLLCEKTGLSISKLMRSLLNSSQLKERPNMDYRELRRSIDRIGNNYNQIAYKANRTDMVSNADWKESRQLLEEVKAEIERWKKIWL